MIVLPSITSGVISSSLSKTFDPKKISGLSLWLKADTGTTTVAQQYINQIVLSNAGSTFANGTYTRASGGHTSFQNQSNGSTINWSNDTQWTVDGLDNDEEETLSLYSLIIIEYNGIEVIDEIDYMDGIPDLPSHSVTTTPNGNTVVIQWADQSGSGNNCPAAINARLLASPSRIYLDGLNSRISLSEAPFINLSVLSLFAVWSVVDNPNGGVIGTSSTAYFEIETTNGSKVRMRNGSYTPAINTGGWWNNGNFSLSTLVIDTSDASGTMRKNGSTAGVNFVPANAESVTYAYNPSIGYNGGGYTELYLKELIIYRSKLTDTQIIQVESYLNSKYAIY
jgi:hypothetical protein